MGRRAIIGTTLLTSLMMGCVTNVRVEVETGGERPPVAQEVTPPQDAANSEGGSGPLGADEVVCAARDAVVTALDESPEGWAAGVAEETRNADCGFDEDGNPIFGHWTMTACAADCETRPMRFLYRREGQQVPSYAAEVAQQGAELHCSDLGQFLVVPKGAGSE